MFAYMPPKGFEPESLSHILCRPATLPNSTHVLIGRVAAMSNKCDKNIGSNPLRGIIGKRNMDRGSNPRTVQPTENAKSILENTLLYLKIATIGKESGGGKSENQCSGNITFVRHAGHSANQYRCTDWQSGQHV
jgi:hypothetical protein